MKQSFTNDYSDGAHPRILEAIVHHNDANVPGYGEDPFCQEAAQLIRQQILDPSTDVHFVTGGTQANLVALASLLHPYESVIAARTAHIAVHEAGAIEATGHRIHECDAPDGKLLPETIQAVVDAHTDEHMVKPRVVFLSQSTELGTAYTKQELTDIQEVCCNNGLLLYVDGARLGYALMAERVGMSLAEFAARVDMFSMGGTKNGGLFGEAIVICNPEKRKGFRYHLKQRGALFAKARLIGVQFAEFFRDGLYFDLARHANTMAKYLGDGIEALGYKMHSTANTNLRFPILPTAVVRELQKDYGFYIWETLGNDQQVIRLVTSWTTTAQAIDLFLDDLAAQTSNNRK